MTALVSVGSRGDGESQARSKCRRHRSLDEKLRLVALTYEPGASVALVARGHDVNANRLLT